MSLWCTLNFSRCTEANFVVKAIIFLWSKNFTKNLCVVQNLTVSGGYTLECSILVSAGAAVQDCRDGWSPQAEEGQDISLPRVRLITSFHIPMTSSELREEAGGVAESSGETESQENLVRGAGPSHAWVDSTSSLSLLSGQNPEPEAKDTQADVPRYVALLAVGFKSDSLTIFMTEPNLCFCQYLTLW